MSVTTIRDGVITILTAAGAKNVAAEEPGSFAAENAPKRIGTRVHYWRVKAGRAPGIGGAGYIDRRHTFAITGFLGVARDRPDAETVSDIAATDLLDAVVAALEAAANARPGSAIDRDGDVAVQPIRTATVNDGQESVAVHVLTIQVTYTEAN